MDKREHATAKEMGDKALVDVLVKDERWRKLKELADDENPFAIEAIQKHEASVAKNIRVNLKSKKRHSKRIGV